MNSEKITKVKFRDGGLGGMVVTFEKPSKRSNENFRDEYKVNYKAPVHKDLLDFKTKLIAHLRDICRLSDDVADEEIFVTEISSNAYDQFVLRGNVRTYGETESPLKTPNIQDGTGYGKFLDVIEIIQGMYNEIRVYMRAEKQVDLVQLAMDFAAKDKKANVEDVAEMSDDQKEEYAREYLESKKYIVIPTEEEGGEVDRFSGSDGDDGCPADEEIESDLEEKTESPEVEESPDDFIPEGDVVLQQPGFGSTVPTETGKVLPLEYKTQDPDDMGEVRKRARKIN